MAITMLEVRTAINARLSLSIAQDGANSQIWAALQDMAKIGQWPDLYTSGNIVYASGNKSKAFPVDLIISDTYTIAGFSPLVQMRFAELHANQEQQSPVNARPEEYAERGGELFVYPIPDGAYTVVAKYWQQHPSVVVALEAGVILFGESFREAVIARSIVEWLKSQGMTKHKKLIENMNIYNRQIALLRPEDDTDVAVTQPYVYGQRG